MTLPFNLLIAAGVLAAGPAPALAQAWPAVTVAGTPGLRLQTQSQAAAFRRAVPVRRATARPALMLPAPRMSAVDPDMIQAIDIRAKAAWSDDEGFRVSPTRVAFKRRF